MTRRELQNIVNAYDTAKEIYARQAIYGQQLIFATYSHADGTYHIKIEVTKPMIFTEDMMMPFLPFTS